MFIEVIIHTSTMKKATTLIKPIKPTSAREYPKPPKDNNPKIPGRMNTSMKKTKAANVNNAAKAMVPTTTIITPPTPLNIYDSISKKTDIPNPPNSIATPAKNMKLLGMKFQRVSSGS